MSLRRFGPYTVETSNEDKVFFPGEGLTKGDLIDYYVDVAGSLLPHTEGRPLAMHRFPDGIDGDGFYQKEVGGSFPGWIETIRVKKEGGAVTQAVCGNAATLAFIANQACVTLHPWLSRRDRLDHPDRMIFDLDPPGDDFSPVRLAARALRALLEDELDLTAFVQTTGSSGLHVVVALDRSHAYDDVRAFAHGVARVLARRDPARLTVAPRKAARKGRLFLDYLRNAYGQMAVAPYSVRALPGAPVATPLDWDELDDSDLTARRYTIRNVRRRLGQRQDPWRDLRRHASSLGRRQERLAALADDARSGPDDDAT